MTQPHPPECICWSCDEARFDRFILAQRAAAGLPALAPRTTKDAEMWRS